jgi:epoxide hydrolase-like predicted phosphatase
MPIRAVIFDFGGVLMRTHDYAGRRKWEARLGLEKGGLEAIVFGSDVSTQGMLGEAPMEAAWQHVADALHVGPAELEELQRDFWSGDRIDQELVDFLAGLRPRYKTGLLSNAWDNARRLFREFGLDRAFDVMVISAEERLAKPDARIYHIALDRLGVRPEEAVFVDDMAANVAAAQSIGLRGIQFQSTEQTIRQVQDYLDGARSSE